MTYSIALFTKSDTVGEKSSSGIKEKETEMESAGCERS
jgi:hypothetical protein